MVCSFIDILVNILNCLYRSADLNINMRVELLEEVQVIWNDLIVIIDNFLARGAWFIDYKRPAIILVLVLGIPIFADNCHSCKRL